MPARALTLDEVAAEIGRSAEWLSRHWHGLVRRDGMPKPLLREGRHSWSAAQLYAWLDRDLPPRQRIAAAAYRAAFEAALAPASDSLANLNGAGDLDTAAWTDRLSRRYAAGAPPAKPETSP